MSKIRIPEVVELGDMTDVNVRAAFIVRFGPQCAAWLCNRFRRKLLRVGVFTVHFQGSSLPPWFDIAINYLEKHRAKWEVRRELVSGVWYFRVYWNGRKNRALPSAIVPVGQA